MLRAEIGRRQRMPARDAREAAHMVRLANQARRWLREGRKREYKRTLKELSTMAAAIGARVVDNRDLCGMVVGLEFDARPGQRNWLFLA